MTEFARFVAIKDAGDFSGIPRHVSSEGCQFVVHGELPAVGQRLLLLVKTIAPITGKVRWVLRDRVAVVFESPASKAMRAALEKQGAMPGGVTLLKA